MKTKITKLVLLTGIIVTMTTTVSAQTSNSGRDCEVISQYYDPSLPEEMGQATPAVRAECPPNHHTPFPGTHRDDRLENGHPNAKKTTTQPISKHIHRYVNESPQQLNQNGQDFFHISVIDKFEMQLQEDFMDNVILNSVKCPNLPNNNNCVGVGNLGTVVKPGGTYKLGFITSFNKNTGVITWHFPGSQFENYIPDSYSPAPGEKWMKPIIDGNHPELYELLGSDFDPTPEENRMLERSINFESKNIEEDFWSATVTSRILIKERVASVSSDTNSIDSFDSLDWEVIPHPADEAGEFSDYFWFPIGTTTTIWERPQEEVLNVCTSIDASLTDETIDINGKTAHKLRFNGVNFTQEIPAGLLIKWTSGDPQGEFWTTTAAGGFTKIGTGSATTNQNEDPVYYIGEGPVTIEPDLPNNQILKSCRLTFEIPEIEQVCKNLFVDHNETIYTDYLSYFNTTAKDTQDNQFPGDIKYSISVDENYGYFYTVKPDDIPDNPSRIIYETNPFLNYLDIFNNINVPIFQPAADIFNDFQLDFENQIPQPFAFKTKHYGLSSILALNIDPIGGTGLIDESLLQPEIPLIDPFGDIKIPLPDLLSKTVTVSQDEPVYFQALKPGDNVVHVRPITTEVPACSRSFSIVEAPKICDSLNFTSIPQDPLEIGQTATLEIAPVDQFGNPLPPETQIKLETTAGGKFTTAQEPKTVIELGQTATLSQFPIQFEESGEPGEVTVSIYPKDPSYSAQCEESIDIGEGLTCLDCNFDLLQFPLTPATELKKETLYTVKATATYSQANYENTITYKLDPQYGTFIQMPPLLANAVIAPLKSTHNLTSGTLESLLGAAPLTNELTADEDKTVVFVTYSNAPNVTDEDTLQIQATGFFNEECHKKVGFGGDGAAECKNLLLGPVNGKFEPDQNKYTIFNITGNFKNHPGQIEVSLSGPGSLSKIGVEDEKNTLIFSNNEVINSNNNLAFSYKRTEPFDPDSNIQITAKAVGPKNTTCEDTVTFGGSQELKECLELEITNPNRPWEIDPDDDRQLFQIKVKPDPSGLEDQLYYNWKVDDGDGEWKENGEDFISKLNDLSQELENFEEGTLVRVWASKQKNGTALDTCEDYIKARSEDDEQGPKITKYVFPNNNLDDLDDLINISEHTEYVTYMIRFEAGNQVKSAKIWEKDLTGNGIIGNPLGGSLEFDAMRININHNGDRYTILKTPGYQEDNENSSNFSDTKFPEKGNGADPGKYQEDYECSETENDLCIDGNFDSVVNDFKNGNPIKFRNLKSDTVITIKYQLENKSKISEEKCKDLTSVCGEEFNNQINYIAYEDDDFTGNDYEDFDKARVIVICPFILTREGGDVFFHDVIDTGVDVAQCSEVKGHTGPGVTPTPVTPGAVPKTGAGDIPEDLKLSLTLPSHDICKYSNLGTNIKGYNDVLKHFSSTICELRANVAKEWTESHINKSINANIVRISRFGDNVIINMNDRNSVINPTSGVFVSNSDLIIGSPGIDFEIKAFGKVPAAQTYIVKNADLHINSNVKYYAETDYTDPGKIATAAFIVVDGNIIIDPSVTHIDGILMAVDTDASDNDGKVTQPGATTNRLTINGNLIGNVYELFERRTGVGDPKKDQGSVTIHYDERILLNTPPGISELIDLKQTIVPN